MLGTGLVLQNNAGDDVAVAADGSFVFSTKVAAGAGYAVSVKTQPNILTRECAVTNGSGTVAAAAVTNVAVVCAPPAARFAYVVNETSPTCLPSRSTRARASLRISARLSTAAVGAPHAMAVHPLGKAAYVIGSSTGEIWQYNIDPQRVR
jgi:6-phosphogluconolactonase